MESELGKVKVILGSNKLVYGIELVVVMAFIYFGFAWNNIGIHYITIGIACLCLIYIALSIVKQKIIVYENGMVINKIFGKEEFKNEHIDHFEWTKITSWYAFIPISVIKLNIVMKQAYPKSVIRLSSFQFAELKKKIMAAEAEIYNLGYMR